MFIVKLYTIQLVVFSGFLNYTYAMIDRTEKTQSHQSTRQDRQVRPILNSIIFLLAANLVAKGALGLGPYQGPTIPGNVQGTLFLSLNQPNKGQQHYYPVWYPLAKQGVGSTLPPRPLTQTQLVSIGEPIGDIEEIENFQRKEAPYDHKFYRFNSIEDPLEPASSEEVKVKTSSEDPTTSAPEETTTLNPDVEILPKNFTTEPTPQELARQATPMNQVVTTNPPVVTPATTTTVAPVATSTEEAGNLQNTTNTTAPNNTTNNVYGPPIYGPPSIFYGPPSVIYGPPQNSTPQNMSNTNMTNPGYPYPPSGNYGPWTGNENISIAYGPPTYQPPFYQKPFYPKPNYQKPFLSSPEDPYLNNYNQYHYNNFYNRPPYYSDGFKYNDFFKSFYSKFDYNYPSFYSNYLGKK